MWPDSVYQRFQQRPGNKQSQLPEEVKAVLERTYTRTKMRGDGEWLWRRSRPTVEVARAFLLTSGRYWICDTNDGGRDQETDPLAELKT